MLDLKGINAFYGTFQVLKNVSLSVTAGDMVTIVGAKGAGKTTLLKILSGMGPLRNGTIRYLGSDLSRLSPEKIVLQGISQVPEGRQLFAHLTVLDNLLLGAYFYTNRKFKQEVQESLDRIFTLFPVLKNRAKQLAGTLKSGEQQMLAIGRALMARPKLLLLDEPSWGLAPSIVQELFQVILGLNKQGMTILLAEQKARAAFQIARYGYVLETGSVAREGPTQELLGDLTAFSSL